MTIRPMGAHRPHVVTPAPTQRRQEARPQRIGPLYPPPQPSAADLAFKRAMDAVETGNMTMLQDAMPTLASDAWSGLLPHACESLTDATQVFELLKPHIPKPTSTQCDGIIISAVDGRQPLPFIERLLQFGFSWHGWVGWGGLHVLPSYPLADQAALVGLLVRYHADPNAETKYGAHTTPLFHIVSRRSDADDPVRAAHELNAVKTLLEFGADPNGLCWPDMSNVSAPLHGLATHTKPWGIALAQMLLDHGATVDIRTAACYHDSTFNETPLMLACGNGQAELVALLLTRGANPELVDSAGNTALHYAAESGNPDVARALLQHHTFTRAQRRDARHTAWHAHHWATYCALVF